MNKLLKISDLNKRDRPRERLLRFGANALADYELLAILLSSGNANSSVLDISQQLLKEFGGFKGLLEAQKEQITKVKGIGYVRFAIIKATLEISHRLFAENGNGRKTVKNPEDIIKIVQKDLFNKKREHLYLISLDSRNKFISKDLVSIGTVNTTLVTPREVFRMALVRGAVLIVLVHNHPSNDPNPSTEDIVITEKIAQLGKELNIPLIDHVIFADGEHISLKSMGIFDTCEFKKKGGES